MDANICVYAFDISEPIKKEKAKSLLRTKYKLTSDH